MEDPPNVFSVAASKSSGSSEGTSFPSFQDVRASRAKTKLDVRKPSTSPAIIARSVAFI